MQPILQQEQKGFYALILPVILSVFSIFLTMGIGFGVLPSFVHEQLAYNALIVGLVIGIQNITALCTRSLAGNNTDSQGTKNSVTKGVVWVVVSGIVYMFASLFAGIPLLSLGLLITARITHGLSESYLITGALTWGIGLAGVLQSGKVMAWVGISLFAGIGLGAPLGDFMKTNGGILSAFVLVTLLPLLGSLPMFRLPSIAVSAKKREISFFKVIAMIWEQGASLALSAIGYGCISSFIALFFMYKNWGDASLAFTVFASTFILTRLFFASFPDKYGGYRVAAISLAIEFAGQLLLWLAVSKTMALAGCALTGMGFSLMFPAMGVEAVKKVKPEMRGSAMGAYTAFTDLALGITGPVAGWIANYFGYPSIFLFGTLCSLLSFLLIIGRKS
jgi:MFS family permease